MLGEGEAEGVLVAGVEVLDGAAVEAGGFGDDVESEDACQDLSGPAWRLVAVWRVAPFRLTVCLVWLLIAKEW